LTFIESLLKRYRTDGTVEPRLGRPISKLSPEQEAVLATLVEEDNDAILVELCDRLEQGGVCALVERRWDALSKSSSSPGKKTLHQLSETQQEYSS